MGAALVGGISICCIPVGGGGGRGGPHGDHIILCPGNKP